uniref:DUF946 domain-containing protein n=1 Tax=Bionectria ochroleuca TaxID=29856 RepID=A0A8H7NI21_BIOOC
MANPATDNGEFIRVMTSSFDPIWNDKGSGAARDGAFWHPKAQAHLRPMGSIAVGNYSNINGNYSAILVGANPNVSTKGVQPPVASPEGYNQIWNDKGSGAEKDGSIWRPVAPSGYVAMGDIAQSGYSQPDTNRIWCLRADLAKNARYGTQSIWDDKKSGADKDVSVWEIQSNLKGADDPKIVQINSFRASQNYSPPDTSFAVLPEI